MKKDIGHHLILFLMKNHTNNGFGILIILGALFFISGCAPMFVDRICPSYVTSYQNMIEIRLEKFSQAEAKNYIAIIYIFDQARNSDLNSKGEQKEKFERLCQKHGDVSYNRVRMLPTFGTTELISFADRDFSMIEITSDSDFDAEHPAGTSLGDIVRFLGSSPIKYIQSGYSKYYHYDEKDYSEAYKKLLIMLGYNYYFDPSVGLTDYPIDKKVETLTEKDLILLGGSGGLGVLYFEKTPENIKEHTITLKMTTDDGDVFENSIKIVF